MRKLIYLFLLLILIPSIIFSQEDELTWPREIETEEGVVTIYQPQIDSFAGDTLQGRMAISLKPPEGEMIFCAVWVKAGMSTDLDERTVTLETIDIPKINFPDMEDDSKITQLKKFLKNEVLGCGHVPGSPVGQS
jgi:hypothetical protein